MVWPCKEKKKADSIEFGLLLMAWEGKDTNFVTAVLHDSKPGMHMTGRDP